MRSGERPRHRRGFSYLGLLYAVAIAGTLLAAAGTLWSTQARREKEQELLFAGAQIRAAIAAYWEKAPAGRPHDLPARLEDLLDDKRWPTTRRHLRRVYADPMTGRADWVLVQSPDGRISGVHSRSTAAPLKQAHFALADEAFADATSYRDWRFVFTPGAPAAAPAATPR